MEADAGIARLAAANLNYADPVWVKLLRDVRFRRALSLRSTGARSTWWPSTALARERDTVLPESQLFKPDYAAAWSAFDPDQANRLLDELGLTERDSDDMRLLPDGRVARIVVETAGESTLETDVLELITDHWAKIAFRCSSRPRSARCSATAPWAARS